MDVPTPSTFLSPILTVASVWNTEETGDMCFLIFGTQALTVVYKINIYTSIPFLGAISAKRFPSRGSTFRVDCILFKM